jgi:hypothetical protein
VRWPRYTAPLLVDIADQSWRGDETTEDVSVVACVLVAVVLRALRSRCAHAYTRRNLGERFLCGSRTCVRTNYDGPVGQCPHRVHRRCGVIFTVGITRKIRTWSAVGIGPGRLTCSTSRANSGRNRTRPFQVPSASLNLQKSPGGNA